MNALVRKLHRWLSIAFTLIVAAIFAGLGAGIEPAQWVYFAPLPPLALMMLSGLYMFFLPYAAKRRMERSNG
jgi:hypothetical protein